MSQTKSCTNNLVWFNNVMYWKQALQLTTFMMVNHDFPCKNVVTIPFSCHGAIRDIQPPSSTINPMNSRICLCFSVLQVLISRAALSLQNESISASEMRSRKVPSLTRYQASELKHERFLSRRVSCRETLAIYRQIHRSQSHASQTELPLCSSNRIRFLTG